MKHLKYVSDLMRFAFRENSLFYLSIAISIFSVVIELLAMSNLLPLFTLVSGGSTAPSGIIVSGLNMLGLAVSAAALLWTFIILFAVRIITQLAGQSLSTYLGKRVMAQLCSRAFEQIVRNISIQKINDKSMGFYISLAGDESFRASTLVISLTQFVSTAFLAILYFAAIAQYSAITAGLIMIFLLLSFGVLFRLIKLSLRLGSQQTEESRKTGSVFLDALNNIKTVRAFSAESYVVGIHRSMMFGYTKTLFWVEEIVLLTKLVPVLLLLLVFGVWLMWSAQAIESIGMAFVVTMIVYLMRFFPTVGQGVHLLLKVGSDARSGKDVTAILATKHNNKISSDRILGKIKHINLCDIHFNYENSKSEILNGVNLKFEQGRSYALVGKSGIGKSTLVDILLKFYLPTSGHLYFNNESISEVADSEIRNKVILVSQEGAIFDDTVTHNVCMGRDTSLDEVKLACEIACIHDVIEGMPEGYSTRLQYQGKNLSGGQRQRIAIARAVLRKPDVLIFDESTSALDKLTQEKVVGNILREYSDSIVIFITHDPHVMKQVDEIVDFGEINLNSAPLTLISKALD